MIKLIYDSEEPARIDSYLADNITELSRSSIQKLIHNGSVLVNGKEIKSNYKIRSNESVEVIFDPIQLEEIPEIKLPILYEDDDCLVIDKPIGVLTHSKGQFNPEGTVATFIRSRLKGRDGERAGIVHRLDRATSGVIICAKTPEALALLQKQFSSRKVKKTYVAVIEGPITPEEAIIDMPIERNPKKPQTFRTGKNGKPAKTHYKVTKSNEKLQLLELTPETGRTHQLRVHLAQLGHPIIGDTFYEGQKADRLYLHAHKLEITLPNRERKVFVSLVPNDFVV